MKKFKRWRYKCDHCGKVGGSGHHMKNHENRCTMNPDRQCGMCGLVEEIDPDGELTLPLSELTDIVMIYAGAMKDVDQYREQDVVGQIQSALFAELRPAAHNCPACILAALRLADHWWLGEFDFKVEGDVIRSEAYALGTGVNRCEPTL